MKKIYLLLACLITLKAAPQNTYRTQCHQDLDFFWQTLTDNYCYFDKKHIDWAKLKPAYDAQIDTVTGRPGFVSVLERAIYELYDHHCGLRTNNKTSRRLVPTAADIWAEYHDGKPVVVEVRKGFSAEKVGIRVGMEVISISDVPVSEAIKPFLSHVVNDESKSFALRLALAGNHIDTRKITLKSGTQTLDFYPDKDGTTLENITYPAMVEAKVMPGNVGYLKINNYLFDNAIIAKFDSALNTLMGTKSLIIDLRETPSGGNTAVARAILGRFISKDHFYQKHELFAEEKSTGVKRSWQEIVSPRGRTYTKPLIVLADHWTGSIAEGITIAFDGMKRATVIGTQLARLNGAVDGFDLPNSKIGVNIVTERLYHINGTPREFYKPTITVNTTAQKPGNDVILNAALNRLKNTK